MINGGRVTIGLAGQEILSLLHAYQVTNNETLLEFVLEPALSGRVFSCFRHVRIHAQDEH